MKTKTKTNLLYHLTGFGLILSTAVGCVSNAEQAQSESAIPAAPIAEVAVLDTAIYQEYVATIQAVKNVEIRTRLTGFLEKIFVDEGAHVKAGQPLFKLNDAEYLSEVARSQAVLDNAIADGKTIALEVERTKLLVDKNIVSETDLEVAQAKLSAAESRIKEARSMLDFAKTQLAYTTIRAPFTGQIDRIPLKEGSLLDEGTLLTSISDLSEVYAYFDISEQEYLGIMGRDSVRTVDFSTPVHLTLADGSVYPHTGTAEFAENEFDESTGTISLRARFANPDGLIKHAASGKVNVPLQHAENLVVHQKSVFEIQDRTYVYMLRDDNTVAMTPFRAGPRVGHYYLIYGGLQARDKIVFEGTQNLRDGMKIVPIFEGEDKLVTNGNQ